MTDAISAAATAAAAQRSIDLRVRDGQRTDNPEWLRSERLVGGACYVDRYAGNFTGLIEQVPALRDLGITYLHVLAIWAEPTPGQPRTLDPRQGSAARFAELADTLHLAGIALGVDLDLDRLDPARDRMLAVHEALHLANLGVDIIRIDAGAAADDVSDALRIAAPGVALVTRSQGDDAAWAAGVGDPGLSAALWQGLDSGTAEPLARTLAERPPLPASATWLTHVRDDDAIAPTAGTDTEPRVGTTASLAGLSAHNEGDDDQAIARIVLAHAIVFAAGGLPVLWLGDEVAQLNDDTYLDDPARRDDPRWLHRGQRPRDRYAALADPNSAPARVRAGIARLISARRQTPELAGATVIGFDTGIPSVLGFQRPSDESTVLVLANLSTDAATIDAVTLSGYAPEATDVISGATRDLRDGLDLPPLGFAWLRVLPAE